MGRKGGTKHLKRRMAPKFWRISVKRHKWTVKPSPGPHPGHSSIPLLILMRDVLGVAKDSREARRIIHEGAVKVDGKIRRDDKFPVGFMDVVEVGKDAFRVLLYPRRGMVLHPIQDKGRKFKLCRIEGKSFVRGRKLQLNLHDGENILVKIKDPTKPVEDVYKRFDTLKVSVPDHKILGHVKFKEGSYAMISGGRNAGIHGEIKKIGARKTESPIIDIKTKDGKTCRSINEYVFCIGEKGAQVSLPVD